MLKDARKKRRKKIEGGTRSRGTRVADAESVCRRPSRQSKVHGHVTRYQAATKPVAPQKICMTTRIPGRAQSKSAFFRDEMRLPQLLARYISVLPDGDAVGFPVVWIHTASRNWLGESRSAGLEKRKATALCKASGKYANVYRNADGMECL